MNSPEANRIASESFTNTKQNRDSLTPVPSRPPGPDCVHRDVTKVDTLAAEFSAQRGHPVYPIRLPSNTVSLSIGDLDPVGTVRAQGGWSDFRDGIEFT